MPSATYPYNSQSYTPAMPVMVISVSGLQGNDPIARVEALVDSGADATMLPADLLRHVKASFHETRVMRGVTGHRVAVDTYFVTIRVGPFEISGVEAVGMVEGTEVILGRDVLNQLEITLHGPAQELWLG